MRQFSLKLEQNNPFQFSEHVSMLYNIVVKFCDWKAQIGDAINVRMHYEIYFKLNPYIVSL